MPMLKKDQLVEEEKAKVSERKAAKKLTSPKQSRNGSFDFSEMSINDDP